MAPSEINAPASNAALRIFRFVFTLHLSVRLVGDLSEARASAGLTLVDRNTQEPFRLKKVKSL
jgi:hypothetical protein